MLLLMMKSQSPEKILKLEVFVLLDNCTCMFEHYIDRVFKIILPYKSQIRFDVKNVRGQEAIAYKLSQNAVVVNGEKVFNSLDGLERFLQEYFNKKEISD